MAILKPVDSVDADTTRFSSRFTGVVSPGIPEIEVPSDLGDILHWAEKWLPTLDPRGFGRHPVYVVHHELPGQYRAATSGWFDFAFRNEVGERWAGRGHGIVVDLRHFEVDEKHARGVCNASDGDIAYMRHCLRKVLAQTLIHEAAHLAVIGEPVEVKHAPEVVRKVVTEQLSELPPAPAVPVIDPDHGRDFTRAGLHLAYRASEQGLNVHMAGLAAGARYNMSRIELYHAALGNEPEKLADQPVFEILKQPAPASFERLWRQDITVATCDTTLP